MSDPPSETTTNGAAGNPLSTKSQVLETGASAIQSFQPVSQICAHLNAYHIYASDPSRAIESNHYCSHLNEDVRQCLIYDSPAKSARLIGIEYMISAALFATLDAEEKKLWHSHVFEVKSGMLIMPAPTSIVGNTTPSPVAGQGWEKAETAEMEDVVTLYGKTWHFWQVDRGDRVPLGVPQLMGSLTDEGQMDRIEGFRESLEDRNRRFGVDGERKRELRRHIAEPEVQEDADQAWKK